MKSIFGYGSLILPTSVVGRFDEDIREELENLMQKKGYSEDFLDLYLSQEAFQKLDNLDINFLPAKIYGLERSYSLEGPGEGNMLTAEKSTSKNYINGVIIFPLKENQFEKISETEESYRKIEKDKDQIETYIPESKLEEKGIEIPNKVTIYVASEDTEDINKNTTEKRNEIYHQYIEEGAKILAGRWFDNQKDRKKFKNKFMKDFRGTTLEINEKGEWEKLSEK